MRYVTGQSGILCGIITDKNALHTDCFPDDVTGFFSSTQVQVISTGIYVFVSMKIIGSQNVAYQIRKSKENWT